MIIYHKLSTMVWNTYLILLPKPWTNWLMEILLKVNVLSSMIEYLPEEQSRKPNQEQLASTTEEFHEHKTSDPQDEYEGVLQRSVSLKRGEHRNKIYSTILESATESLGEIDSAIAALESVVQTVSSGISQTIAESELISPVVSVFKEGIDDFVSVVPNLSEFLAEDAEGEEFEGVTEVKGYAFVEDGANLETEVQPQPQIQTQPQSSQTETLQQLLQQFGRPIQTQPDVQLPIQTQNQTQVSLQPQPYGTVDDLFEPVLSEEEI
eukprot:TRINITY_DN4084_c0_g1_i12.p1 TRINITY_DN4084_c0_g1~~TRINITY_DN4084_c0_g1_i12.p1  ORF type:complete len:265 (-),score=62.58 TRINITY_DN4084_c0_g1_i12:133-927(-)